MSAAFLTPLLRFFEIFQVLMAVRTILANLVMVCAAFAVPAATATPKVMNAAAIPMTGGGGQFDGEVFEDVGDVRAQFVER